MIGKRGGDVYIHYAHAHVQAVRPIIYTEVIIMITTANQTVGIDRRSRECQVKRVPRKAPDN